MFKIKMLMQKVHTMKQLLTMVILTVVSSCLVGQDLHYTQFYNAPHTYNPAHVGVYNGDKKIQADLRDQWRWVPVPWFTFGMAYDQKVYLKDSDKHFLSLGGNLAYDRQGDSRLSLASINFNPTYSRILTPNHILTGGLTLGFSTRGFSQDELTWDNQWTGETVDLTRPSGEGFNTENIYFLETGLGVNYRWQRSRRTKLDIGIGALHLIEPSAGFYDNEDQKLPMHINFSAIGNFYLTENLDIQLHGLHQMQNEYRETVVGGLAKLYLNKKRGKQTELHAGLGYRFSGSIAPTVALQYNQIYVGLSYDSDRTDFNSVLEDNKGGPEIHVRYTITNVKPLQAFKVCPIY